ncbi:MAG: PucR family transcriptional regulator ligand-binding domain-containing protein [Corynebacterium sp.]|nr:PucR family transcriptional regulator ligand-binding domain-containing protein [Corynebacterium sp.]
MNNPDPLVPSVTVPWLLGQRSLNLREVVPSTAQLCYVQPSELRDPTQFLLRNSLVLTVGIAFESTPDDFADYAARLHATGVAAIGFGTGLSFAEIPAMLVTTCKELSLGLFEVPHQTPFVSIQNVVQREFYQQQTLEHEQLMLAYRRLDQAAINQGVTGLLETTAQLIQATCVIRDNDDRFIAQASYTKAGGKGTVRRVTHKMLNFGDRYHQFVTSSNHSLSPNDRLIIKHATSLADLLLQRPTRLRNDRSELNTLALNLLLGADGSDAQLNRIFARISDSEGNVRPVLIHSNVPTIIDKAFTTVDAHLAVTNRDLCAIKLDATTALMLFRGTRSVSNILELFDTTKERLRICIDIAQPWRFIDNDLIAQMTVSVKALTLGTYSSPQTNTVRWLNNPHVLTALNQRAQETVEKLDAHDRNNHTDLRTTLAVYLQQGASITLTSDTLGVHRHTVRTRLKKIAEICEVNLDDPVTRAELLLIIITRSVPTTA